LIPRVIPGVAMISSWHFRDQHVVGVGIGERRVAGDKARVTAHQLDRCAAALDYGLSIFPAHPSGWRACSPSSGSLRWPPVSVFVSLCVRSGRAHRAGAPPRDPLDQAHSPARHRCRRRHAHVGEQRFFSRCQCSDHAHRPRRAEPFSELGAPAAILRPATLRARPALCEPRCRRPDRSHPLRAAET